MERSIAAVNMPKTEKPVNKGDLSLVWLLLFSCGNPFIGHYLDRYIYIVLLVLIFILYKPHFTPSDKKTLYRWLGLLFIIFAGQLITLKYISYLACLNYMAKLTCGFCIATVLGARFKDAYLSVMTVICVISLFFFSLQALGFSIPNLLPEGGRGSIGIYSISMRGDYDNYQLRNAGMFWEPGAFAGYINIAFVLFINNLKELIVKHKRKVIILLIALLTTFSTTGYIILALIVAFYILDSRANGAVKLFFLVATMVLALMAFTRLDFLGEKITSQFENASVLTFDSNEHSRFGSIIIDWYYITLHPLFGNGFALETRYAYHLQFYDEETLLGFGNGFTGIIGTLGVPFMLFYLYSFYKNQTLRQWTFILTFVILSLQGEQFMNYPLYLMLPFINYGGYRAIKNKPYNRIQEPFSQGRKAIPVE